MIDPPKVLLERSFLQAVADHDRLDRAPLPEPRDNLQEVEWPFLW